MGRFDDQPRFTEQDKGYRFDEVRGPYREEWAEQPAAPAKDPTDSIGGGSGLGEHQNPAWAGASANHPENELGRGQGPGEEGPEGYGEYIEGGSDLPASANADHRHFGREGGGGYGVYDIGGKGAEGFHRVANSTYDDVVAAQKAHEPKASPETPSDVGYGTRHWGHGEYKGNDDASDQANKESLIERAVEKVGRFFGVGPKNYRRSDERIHEDVCECLMQHHEVDASEIEVSVKDGVVCLKGTVDDRQTRRLIEDAIAKVAGVREVEDHLRLEHYVARTEEADRLTTGEVPPNLHS